MSGLVGDALHDHLKGEQIQLDLITNWPVAMKSTATHDYNSCSRWFVPNFAVMRRQVNCHLCSYEILETY